MATPVPPSSLYSPLKDASKEFRLLQIWSGDPKRRQVDCSVASFTINQCPPYLALSYTWGPAEERADSAEPHRGSTEQGNAKYSVSFHCGQLAITENLYLALQELLARAQGPHDSSPVQPGTYFWVDAICINQDDMDERMQQVQIMDRIYSYASTVVVWLGPDSDNSMSTVIGLLEKLVDLETVLYRDLEEHQISWNENILLNHTSLLLNGGLPSAEDTVWTAVEAFFNRRWFRRLWAVQEVALARNVEFFCGDKTLDWSLLSSSSAVLNKGVEDTFTSTSPASFCQLLVAVKNWCTTGDPPVDDMDVHRVLTGRESYEYEPLEATALLFYFLDRHLCSDRRDQIFGLLGILKKITSSDTTFIQANYMQDPVSVYIQAGLEILQRSHWLGFCTSFKCHAIASSLQLPSWVPQFESDDNTVISLLSGRRENQRKFNAPGPFLSSYDNPAPELRFNGTRLGFTGCKVATIKVTSHPLDEWSINDEFAEAAIQMVLDLAGTYPFTGQSRLEAFWRTLVVDTYRPINATADEMAASFASWWLIIWLMGMVEGNKATIDDYLETIPNVELLARSDKSGVIADHEAIKSAYTAMLTDPKGSISLLEKQAYTFSSAQNHWSHNRSLFTTHEGHVGNAIATAQEGDEIWISPRAHHPFIVRQVQNTSGSNHYSLIGDCYVHGIMFGEHFDSSPPVWEEAWLV